jgi:uncharacterized membrane protein HdeD (DUF308 family)
MTTNDRAHGVTATGFTVVIDPKAMWPLMALRGVLAILFGIAALVWPGITVLALAILFGAWILLDGISLLINAYQQRRDWRNWVPSLVAGVLGIAAAVITVLWPGITVLVLTILAGLLLIALGVIEMVLAWRLRKQIRGEVFLGLSGLAGVVGGVLILVWPTTGALALTVLLGAYALVSGVLLLGVAWRLRRVTKAADPATWSWSAGRTGSLRPGPR